MATIGVAKKVALETTRKSAPGKRKKTRLLKDYIDNACKNMKMLATAPGLNNATKVIVTAVEADSIHLDAFASRKCLWQRIKTSPAFSELVSKLILGYVDLYKAHRKGKNKYSRFLVSWHEFFTCCKRIRRGDSMISFLLELA